jgi:hypothetical protein
VLEKFREKKADVMALYDSLPDLSTGYRKQARSPRELLLVDRAEPPQKTLVDGCVRTPAM